MRPVGIIGSRAGATSFTGPLDALTTTMSHASDFRRLLSSYTGALIRVQRSSDSTQSDIGYGSNNLLDSTALTTFVGGGNGFLVKRYDQSGNGTDLLVNSGDVGFSIVSSGTPVTLNGKVCAQQQAVGESYYITTAVSPYTGTTLVGIQGMKPVSPAQYDRYMSVILNPGTDWSVGTNAGMIIINGATVLNGTRNSVSLADVSFTAAAAIATSSRFDGANWTLKTALGSSSIASSAAFNIDCLTVGGRPGGGSEGISGGSMLTTTILWLGDPGATNVETARAEVEAFWS